jgi:hypothetical protein
MEQSNYYSYPAISNSMLSAYENTIFPKPFFGNKNKAYELGRLVHQLILEPDKPIWGELEHLTIEDAELAQEMKDSAMNSNLVKWLRQWSRKEEEYYWTDETTQAPLKAKLDMVLKKNQLVVDIKTTSAGSKNAFIKTIFDYGYDRQMAFYADATQSKKATIIGIQKVAPFKVFEVEMTKESLEQGRKKYRALLNNAIKTGYFNEIINHQTHAN